MAEPFAPGTVSLALYADAGEPANMLDRLFQQASIAESAGFDGVTVSEHHGGFAPYVPNPLQLAGWILDRTTNLWAGPCPLLLPLRPWPLVVEELSWLAALHPKRVAAGVAPGYAQLDFDLYGVPVEDRGARLAEALGPFAAALRGDAEGALGDDRAVAANARSPIPLVVAAGSRTAARRAAACRAGIITDSMATLERLHSISEAYAQSGGKGPRVLNRRVWVGSPPRAVFERQRARYLSAAGSGSWLDGAAMDLACGSAGELVDRLRTTCAAAGASHLGVKIHVEGIPHDELLDQITRLGDLLPELRPSLAGAG